MNHHQYNRIPNRGRVGRVCGHCRKKDVTLGTHGGCHECGRVSHNKDGKRNKKRD